MLLSLVASLVARAECLQGVRVPVGPRSVQAQCSYKNADIAASGSFVAGAWMTSRTSFIFGHIITTGSTWGGMMNGRGHLLPAAHAQLNDAAGAPSIAVSSERALLAWTTGAATRARFFDSSDVITITDFGSLDRPPHAIRNGSDFLVIYEDRGAVKSARIGSDERVVIAENAKLADASAAAVVIESASGFELITPTSRRTLPIPSGAAVALGDDFIAWHAGTIGMMRFDGEPVTLATASTTAKRIAVAGDVILWNDGSVVRGTRIGGAAIAGREGLLHAAALTDEGAVALIGGDCGIVASFIIAPGSSALQPTEIVSREPAPQWDRALVATARGQDVFWEEPHPYESATQLFVTHFEGTAPREPVSLSTQRAAVSMLDAAPDGSGSAVVWSEYPDGVFTRGTVRLERIDSEGRVAPPLTLSEGGSVNDVAVVSDGNLVTVFSIEEGALWKSEVRGTAIVRELLLPVPRAHLVDAVMTADGAAAVWIDRSGDSALLTILDANGTRAFPIAYGASVREVVAGDTIMVVWTDNVAEVHAFFPDAGVDVPVATNAGYFSIAADPRPDGTFDLALGTNDAQIFNVTPHGVVTRREDVCLPRFAVELTLRGGTVDAMLDGADSTLFVTTRASAGMTSSRIPDRRVTTTRTFG